MPLGSVFLDELTRPLAYWEVETQPLPKPSVLTITNAIGSNPDWAQELIDYLRHDILPINRDKADRVCQRGKSYIMRDDEIHHKSMSEILQWCIPTEDGKRLLKDIHLGACGHHAAPNTMVGKAFQQGFYWPTTVKDTQHIMRTCEGCQYFAKQKHVPSQELQTIPVTWPFAVWGLDLVGKLPPAPEGFDNLFVMIDKFTKWIEANPVATASSEAAVEFIKEVINQYGVMNMIITDNGTQFTGSTFVNFFDEQ
jgi:hypothetical protein